MTNTDCGSGEGPSVWTVFHTVLYVHVFSVCVDIFCICFYWVYATCIRLHIMCVCVCALCIYLCVCMYVTVLCITILLLSRLPCFLCYYSRIVFLETVAGVPGMVAAMVRHLHSLRKMRRDHGWIHTLLGQFYHTET